MQYIKPHPPITTDPTTIPQHPINQYPTILCPLATPPAPPTCPLVNGRKTDPFFTVLHAVVMNNRLTEQLDDERI